MDVRNIVKQLNISVHYIDMEKPGYATISADKQLKFVFISNRYPARVQKVTLIHELEHIAKQSGQTALYNATVSARFKMESEINRCVVYELVDDYIKHTGIEPENINYIDFMQLNDISADYESFVKETIKNYKWGK